MNSIRYGLWPRRFLLHLISHEAKIIIQTPSCHRLSVNTSFMVAALLIRRSLSKLFNKGTTKLINRSSTGQQTYAALMLMPSRAFFGSSSRQVKLDIFHFMKRIGDATWGINHPAYREFMQKLRECIFVCDDRDFESVSTIDLSPVTTIGSAHRPSHAYLNPLLHLCRSRPESRIKILLLQMRISALSLRNSLWMDVT